MKRFSVVLFSALILALVAATFTACQKDEVTTPTDRSTGIVIKLFSRFQTCQWGTFLCILRDNIPGNELDKVSLEADQFTSRPTVLADGAVQLSGEIPIEKLSAEGRAQLLQERVMVVDESFTLSDNLLKQAYANAGKTYDGQRIQVVKGVYPIDFNGGSGEALKIKITITIKDGELVIKVTW